MSTLDTTIQKLKTLSLNNSILLPMYFLEWPQNHAVHSEKIAEITPEGLNKTFFTTGGADAIENAIKIARLYTGKQK